MKKNFIVWLPSYVPSASTSKAKISFLEEVYTLYVFSPQNLPPELFSKNMTVAPGTTAKGR